MHHDLQNSKLHSSYTYFLSALCKALSSIVSTELFVAIYDYFCCHSYFGLNGLHLSKAASFSPFERFLLLLCHHFIHTWLTFCWMLGRAKTRKLNLPQLVQLMTEDLKRYNGSTVHSTFRLYTSKSYVFNSTPSLYLLLRIVHLILMKWDIYVVVGHNLGYICFGDWSSHYSSRVIAVKVKVIGL